MHIGLSALECKKKQERITKARINYREFDHEGGLVGVPNTWYLSELPFATPLELGLRELDIVAMNN